MPIPAALGAWIALNTLNMAPPPPEPIVLQTGVPPAWAYAAGYRAAQEEQGMKLQKQSQQKPVQTSVQQVSVPQPAVVEPSFVSFDDSNREYSWKEKAEFSSSPPKRYLAPHDYDEPIKFVPKD